MTFPDSIKTCFQKYVVFEGRASRSEFWWFWLACFVAGYIPFIGWIVALGTILPNIAVGVRRIHDVGKSGWWLLCPIYNIVLCATPGQPEENEYGPVPED